MFTALMTIPARQTSQAGSIDMWRDVQSIESVGWKLAEWSATNNTMGLIVVVALFRR